MSRPLMPPFPGPTMQSQPPAYGASDQYPIPYRSLNASAMPSDMSANGQNGMLRYPILPHQSALDAQHIVNARQKKEIKRRTKTGCLTCRKRRIKCDESHPTCRNCQKSKRECLGYDPIFKQQPRPANIQPAPSANTLSPRGTTASSSHHSHHIPHSFPEYGASLDPALAGSDPALAMAQNHYTPTIERTRNVRSTTVDELFSLNGIPPRYTTHESSPPTISPSAREEIESFYKYHYASGLDRLFDTTWYGTHGLSQLLRDPALQDFVVQCTEQFKAKSDDKAIFSLEARLVWQLATMPRTVEPSAHDTGSEELISELIPRIDVIEKLLTGQFLAPEKGPPPPAASDAPPGPNNPPEPYQKYHERLFWYELGKVVSIRDDIDESSDHREMGEVLGRIRVILNMLENRDVFYSLAIARHIGGRISEFHPHRVLIAATNDPDDDINKLKVAHNFIEQEDHHGTTQVIQRICSMSIRSWVLQKE